jgi:deazaflavin-dependent oxidoreductase (nitroreductase family)
MALPDGLARLNRRVTNKVTRPFAGRLPGFAIVVHRGRKSDREYRTPVNAFRTDTGFVIALTYGADRDWVRNVIAAGRCTLVRRGRGIAVANPEISDDAHALDTIPRAVRVVLRFLEVTETMTVARTPD